MIFFCKPFMTWPSKFSYPQPLSGFRCGSAKSVTLWERRYFGLYLAMRSYLEPHEQYFLCVHDKQPVGTVVGHDGLQGASDDFGEKKDKTAMLFNEKFPGKNITMTLKKLIKICPLYFALFVSIIFLLSINLFLLEQYFKTPRQQ